MATKKTIGAAVFVAIAIIGGTTACTGGAEPPAGPVTQILWKDKDADGDGIPNGSDDTVNGPLTKTEPARSRAGVCQQFDNGIVPPHLDDPVHAGRERAKVAAECPEHLAAFDAAVAAPPAPAAPVPVAPSPEPLTEAEERFVTAYRGESWDFTTPASAIIDTAGQVCVALKNRDEDDVRRDLERGKGLSAAQADGLIHAASGQRCIALGW